jgi:riboflavin kinase/FMN adenylyltransferase
VSTRSPLPEVVKVVPFARAEARDDARPQAVVIGNFDGVHRGHVAALAQMTALARERGLVTTVLTFDPHPALVLGKATPERLTTLERRIELFGEHEVERVVVATFSLDFAATSPEGFAEQFLFGELGAEVVVVGADFRFGKGRKGDFETLDALARAHGRRAFATVLETDDEGAISSTRIRKALGAGRVEHAAALLGRPHAFTGTVEHGQHKGRTIGFPTANLARLDEMCPANGVYAVSVEVEEGATFRWLGHGVMNIGTRPTVSDGGKTRHVEIHVFDVDRDLYGRRVRAHVHARVREERKFPSFDELRAQIERDAATARELTSRLGR